MSGRDRVIGMVLAVLVVFGAGWMLLVKPERQKVSALSGQLTAAQAEVNEAESQLSDARSAQAKYSAAYSTVVNLGKAVPAAQEVPSLIYELEGATNAKNVEFNSIVAGSSAGGPASASASASASAASAASAATAAAFSSMPFTFVFEGGFFSLEHLFASLTSYTTHDSSGGLVVDGRLLTVQSVALTPAPSSSNKSRVLTGTITASAYVLPPGAGLTGGATASSPTGSSSSAAPASSTSSSTSPSAPAVVKVAP